MDEKIIEFFRRKEVKQVGRFVNKNSIAVVALISLALFLYTYFSIQAIFDPPINQQRLSEKRRELAQNQIQFDEDLVNKIQSLKEVNVDTEPRNLGTDNNPFD